MANTENTINVEKNEEGMATWKKVALGALGVAAAGAAVYLYLNRNSEEAKGELAELTGMDSEAIEALNGFTLM